MRKMTNLAIFIATTIISGCYNIPTLPPHPGLTLPGVPPLPKFTRGMLDCKEQLTLCRKIKEREAVLTDHIETQSELVKTHNEALEK